MKRFLFFIFTCSMIFALATWAAEPFDASKKPVSIRVLDTTDCKTPQTFPDAVTRLEYGQAVSILKELPPKYGYAVGNAGETVNVKSEKNKAPLPLKVKIEVDRWYLNITFLLSDGKTVEARTVRFDSSKGGDFLIKFKNKSFAVFCGF